MKRNYFLLVLLFIVAVSSSAVVKDEVEMKWSAQPRLGIIKGDYYRAERLFRQGHMGSMEVVKYGHEIVFVEFNERTRPNYYNRYYQDVPKRLSDYNFSMGSIKGAAWIESVLLVEKQMLEEQRITGDFDMVAGASNSIKQSMIPLAEEIEDLLSEEPQVKYYSIAEKFEGGITGRLQITIEDGKITWCHYDEIFADNPEEISPRKFKRYYGESKYASVTYDEPSRIGFNVQIDALNKKVIETQNLLDIEGLPATGDSGDYATTGFTIRNEAWDRYLGMAEKLIVELERDGVL